MASAFSHAAVAVAIGYTLTARSLPARFWLLSVACSILPDADVLGFAAGIPYGHMLGHRGLSHSLAFAVALSAAVVRWGFPGVPPWSQEGRFLLLNFVLVTASHGLLDAMTDGGLGVAFFAPFDNTRYFFPWRPVPVSPIGVAAFFTPYGLQVLLSEFVWIWIPAGLLMLGAAAYRRMRK
jgi:inner membrane protein